MALSASHSQPHKQQITPKLIHHRHLTSCGFYSLCWVVHNLIFVTCRKLNKYYAVKREKTARQRLQASVQLKNTFNFKLSTFSRQIHWTTQTEICYTCHKSQRVHTTEQYSS